VATSDEHARFLAMHGERGYVSSPGVGEAAGELEACCA